MANKICMIGATDDGDRIFCLYKQGTETLARGYYDFNKSSFIITEFYTKKLTPGQTPKDVIKEMKTTLDLNYDWELKDDEKIIKHIEEGIINSKRKRKRKKKKNKNE